MAFSAQLACRNVLRGVPTCLCNCFASLILPHPHHFKADVVRAAVEAKHATDMLRQVAQKAAHTSRTRSYCGTLRWLHAGAPASAAFGSTLPSPTKLEAIVNMDKMLQRSPEQITGLWQEHHAKDQNAAVLSSTEWKAYSARAKACPYFVIPLRKPQGGYLSLVLQQQLPLVIFTTLEEFRTLKDQAPSHLAITHYTELLDDKGLVLAKADAISPHLISTAEARTLMTLTYAFYTDPVSFLHVHKFNHSPSEFDFAELAKELGIGQAAT